MSSAEGWVGRLWSRLLLQPYKEWRAQVWMGWLARAAVGGPRVSGNGVRRGEKGALQGAVQLYPRQMAGPSPAMGALVRIGDLRSWTRGMG